MNMLFEKSTKTGNSNQVIQYCQFSLSKILSLSEGIKKLPLLNFTSNKSFGLIPIIIHSSSNDTRSAGLKVDIESMVFKYGIGTCKVTFSPIEKFIMPQ